MSRLHPVRLLLAGGAVVVAAVALALAVPAAGKPTAHETLSNFRISGDHHVRAGTVTFRQSGNKVLVELASTVAQRVRWLHTPVARSRGNQSWVEHEALIDAIAAGDAERAGKLMAEHTEHTRLSYLAEDAASDEVDEPRLGTG